MPKRTIPCARSISQGVRCIHGIPASLCVADRCWHVMAVASILGWRREWRGGIGDISSKGNFKETSRSCLAPPQIPMTITISKTPLRLSLGGGGTDIPEYYEKHGGFWISGAIDKFIYIAVKERFEKAIRLSYSALEVVEDVDDLEHPIVREVLKAMDVTSHIEITSIGELPSRTGLGSSGSFTVGLVNALSRFKGQHVTSKDLAEVAYKIERETLNRPIGKQDQYIAAFGGVRPFSVDNEGDVLVCKPYDENPGLTPYLSLFYVGRRESSGMLGHIEDSLDLMKQLHRIGEESDDALINRDIERYGQLMDDHWFLKRQIKGVSGHTLDGVYLFAKEHGALGGKLVGAGGGGFLLFVTKERERLIKALVGKRLRHVPFTFSGEGTKILEV